MANTVISTNNQMITFLKKVNHEYVRKGRFEKYIGNDPNSLIQMNKSLTTVSIPLVTKLRKQGVVGNQTLSGNEESLNNYEYKLQPTFKRHAVKINDEEREKSQFDLYNEARPALMNWAMELKRDQIIQAMGAVYASPTYYNYGGAVGATGSTAATGAQMDTWQAANTDRILYGIARSNLTSGDHTTSLSTVDTTNDKLSANMVTLLKRMAMQASPLVKPIMIKGDEPWFVLFVGSYSFRDLRIDLQTEHQYALPRGKDNVLFSGGDLLWDGVIIKEIPEIDIFIDGDGSNGTSGYAFDGVWGANATGDNLKTSGASGSRVGVGFLCGAQAVGFGMGHPVKFTIDKNDDYEFQHGVGISLKDDFKKVFYNNKQHAMITSFHSASTDS